MPGAALSLIPAALGAIGLIQSGNQAKEANNLTNQALQNQQPQVTAQNAILQQALNYNPTQVDQQAYQYASGSAQTGLQQALQSVMAQYGAAGGSPTGDTAASTALNRTASGIINPLVTNYQSQLANAPAQRLAALQSVFSAPSGQLGQTYFQAANTKNPTSGSWQGALQLLQQGLGGYGNASGSGLQGYINDGTVSVDPSTGFIS